MAGFGDRLATAQREHDLLAAAVAATAAGPSPGQAFSRLAALARGSGHLGEASRVGTVAPATVAVANVSAQLQDSEAHARLMLLELRLDGMTLWLARHGVEHLEPIRPLTWKEICSELPVFLDKQLFQLAGGVGNTPVRRAQWLRACAEAVDSLAALTDAPLILVEPPSQWQLLQTAAEIAHDRLHPAATVPPLLGGGALRRFAAAIMADVPRPEGYDVVLRRYEPAAGTTTVQRRSVFPAKVVEPGRRREVQIPIYGSRESDAVVVPIIRAGADLHDPTAGVATAVLKLAAGERAVITARQSEPGRVELVHPAVVENSPPWSELVSHLEALSATGPGAPIDLVIAIELGEPRNAAGAVGDRIDTARRIIDQTAAAIVTPDLLHVGVLGYGDHRPNTGTVMMYAAPLGIPETAADQLSGMAAEQSHNDLSAPLEDALMAIAGMPWRRSAKKVLIVLAGRPPYPDRERMYLPLCPASYKPSQAIGTLPEGLTVIPVLSGPTLSIETVVGRVGRTWADAAWQIVSKRMPIMSAYGYTDLIDEILDRPSETQRLRLALSEPLPS